MRYTVDIVLVLAAGALTNLLVAWSAASNPLGVGRIEAGTSSSRTLERQALTTFGATKARVELYFFQPNPLSSERPADQVGFTAGGFTAAIPTWSGLGDLPEAAFRSGVTAIHFTVDLFGWPMLCFGETAGVAFTPPTLPVAEELRFNRSGGSPFHSPIWPAVLVNCLFYSVAIAPFWIGVRAAGQIARRWRWRRSGRCEGCGYDMHNSAERRCPECGYRQRDYGVAGL